jgi:hypothetical protein
MTTYKYPEDYTEEAYQLRAVSCAGDEGEDVTKEATGKATWWFCNEQAMMEAQWYVQAAYGPDYYAKWFEVTVDKNGNII